MTNLCKEYDKFLSENDERFKELSKENQFYMNAIGYGVKYYDLNRRIDKAIEYIENNWIEYSDFQYVDNDDELNIDCESIKELLDILKGNDEDE